MSMMSPVVTSLATGLSFVFDGVRTTELPLGTTNSKTPLVPVRVVAEVPKPATRTPEIGVTLPA